MEALKERINFAVLSKGEQTYVERINQKHKEGRELNEKEGRFIFDMSTRGNQSY